MEIEIIKNILSYCVVVPFFGGIAFYILYLIVDDYMAQYKDWKQLGKLLEAPCAEGDTVYCIVYQKYNTDDKRYLIVSSETFTMDMLSDVGKTVFLTKPEAEKALNDLNNLKIFIFRIKKGLRNWLKHH